MTEGIIFFLDILIITFSKFTFNKIIVERFGKGQMKMSQLCKILKHIIYLQHSSQMEALPTVTQLENENELTIQKENCKLP